MWVTEPGGSAREWVGFSKTQLGNTGHLRRQQRYDLMVWRGDCAWGSGNLESEVGMPSIVSVVHRAGA